VKLRTPRWWYDRHPRASITRALLRPAAFVWASQTARRIAKARPDDPGLAVICVGNLTMGGSGKTPIVRALLERLTAQGVAAAMLSRGHGGRQVGPLKVDPHEHRAADVGDEPLMMAQTAPVWVARDRLAGARAAAQAGMAAVVMDDGHQNMALKKALSLVVVDGETRDGEWPFGDGAVFPAGPMREPLIAGLRRADAVIVLLPTDLDQPDPALVRLFGRTPVLTARLEPLCAPPVGRQLGFAGVGKPWKIERALTAAGCDLVDFLPLPDHAAYDEALLAKLARLAKDQDAGLVTTEKDWVRLPVAWRARIAAWPVRARFDDQPGLDRLLADALGSARAGPGEPCGPALGIDP
jgi:tetraacyldisaccharide 4'-kinase